MENYSKIKVSSPEAKARVLRCLNFLENEFSQIEEIKKIGWKDYPNDPFKRKIIERWTENLVMTSLDIAKIVLAPKGKGIPQSYKDVLKVFTALYINSSFSKRFSEFAKLRNIIAHEYLNLKWKKIENFVKEAEKLFPVFIEKTKKIFKK